jgi:hypothetical protein
MLQLIECRLGRFSSEFFGNVNECEVLFASLLQSDFESVDVAPMEDVDCVWRRSVVSDGSSRVYLSVVNTSVSLLRLCNPFFAYCDARLQCRISRFLREQVRL